MFTDVVGYTTLMQDDEEAARVALAMLVVVFNVIPDYVSLLETRWALRFMRRSGRRLVVLVLDATATSVVSASFFVLVGLVDPGFGIFEDSLSISDSCC